MLAPKFDLIETLKRAFPSFDAEGAISNCAEHEGVSYHVSCASCRDPLFLKMSAGSFNNRVHRRIRLKDGRLTDGAITKIRAKHAALLGLTAENEEKEKVRREKEREKANERQARWARACRLVEELGLYQHEVLGLVEGKVMVCPGKDDELLQKLIETVAEHRAGK